MILLTNEEALEHLRISEATPDDLDDIVLKMKAASLAIVKYLGEGATFLDEDGDCDPEDVPEDIKTAALLLVGYLYRLRDEDRDKEFEKGYLPAPVVCFLWPHRIPPLG